MDQKHELEEGIRHEKEEHGLSDEMARKIASDHIKQYPNYYEMLEKAEGDEDDEEKEDTDWEEEGDYEEEPASKVKKMVSKKAVKSPAGKAKISYVMGEFKKKELKSGSTGEPVTNRKQALAIALQSARKSK